MTTYRSTHRMLLAAAGCTMLAATSLFAQGRPLLSWGGRVDKEVQITMRDTSIYTSIIGGAPVAVRYSDVRDRLPQRAGTVRVELDHGRGDIDVIQQPSALNDYAAVIRIRDHSVGVDDYRFKAFWNAFRGEDPYVTAANPWAENALVHAPKTMHWSGNVDKDMTIEWHGYSVQSRDQTGERALGIRAGMSGPLPTENVRVELVMREGRGQVSVLEQPTEANAYIARIRIHDPLAGPGHYEFEMIWR